MKHVLALSLASLLLGSTLGAEASAPLWLRHQQISPDGRSIAFCYQGDIYTVPTAGGSAQRITSNAAYDGTPIWSPDSKRLAFSSDREGGKDVYIISTDGSGLRRLTYNSTKEIPVAFLDDNTLLFQADIMPDANFGMYPWSWFVQTYSLDLKKDVARPRLYNSTPMASPSLRNGEILYTDIKGYEDIWRKHAISPVTKDIWHLSKEGKYTKLTTFGGEDRNAVWDDKGGFYYLSERDGSYNIYHRTSVSPSASDERITTFSKNPVRFLSRAENGTLCFGYDGEIYTLTPGGKPQKVAITLIRDEEEQQVNKQWLTSEVSSFAVAPSDKEIAFVAHGDVYVTHTEYKTTKRITDTPQQERDVDISSDGKKIVYAAERDGTWQIYMTELVRKDDPHFVYARELKEKQLTKGKEASFQPLFSPDGKRVAFLRDRTAIYVYDLASGKETKVLDKKFNYSYSDGDQHFRWSPDGKWILTNYIGIGGWMHTDCALVKADGSGEVINLTESGYSDTQGKFVLDGKAILFHSDRSGYRSHGSWGAQSDLYLMFLDREAFEDFKLSKEERELHKELKDLNKKDTASADKKDSKKSKKTAKKTDEEKKDTKPFTPDFTDRENRVIRLTSASGSLSDALINSDGTKLYYIMRYGEDADLWEKDLVSKTTKVLSPKIGYGELRLGKDGKTIYVGTSYGGLSKVESSGTVKPISFSAEFDHRPAEERAYIFDHAWQQVKDKFYDEKLHGVDWDYYRTTYRRFLPHINNDDDFAELLSELLGELNASHTGGRSFPKKSPIATAALGAFYDNSYKGDGLRIVELLQGGPLSFGGSKVEKGMIIERIDGELIKADQPIEFYLNGKVSKRVNLTVLDPKTGKRFDQIVKPCSQGWQEELLYRRWLRHCEDLVRERSGGRVGYVYVRSMSSPSFRTAFQDLLGKYRNTDAVIVDTRYNGGGWLHEDLAHLLSGKKYLTFTPRGQYIGDDPFMQWNKPSCVLVSEGNYSNGHGFPWVYKVLGLGKVIGSPVAGTMTAVWWESQINPYIVFGIPQVTCSDLDGKPLENATLQPDIEVYSTPEEYLRGHDAQLIRAIDEMLKTIPKKK